jgi:hypothetical protein
MQVVSHVLNASEASILATADTERVTYVYYNIHVTPFMSFVRPDAEGTVLSVHSQWSAAHTRTP